MPNSANEPADTVLFITSVLGLETRFASHGL